MTVTTVILTIITFFTSLSQAQITDISQNDIDPTFLTNYYVVELKKVQVGKDFVNISWTDLNQVKVMGRLQVQLAAGYYSTPERMLWSNKTTTYTSANFSYHDIIRGLQPSTWYKICYKGTHIINKYGVESAICAYKKTWDSSNNPDSSVYTDSIRTTNDQIVVDVRVSLTPFNISRVGVVLYRDGSGYPLTTRDVLVQDQGYRQIFSFMGLAPSTVYRVCVFTETNRLDSLTYSNETDCNKFAYTKIPGATDTTQFDPTPVRGAGASGGSSAGASAGGNQDVQGDEPGGEKVAVAGVGGGDTQAVRHNTGHRQSHTLSGLVLAVLAAARRIY